MTMPKHSSKFDQSISPTGEVMRQDRQKWIVFATVVIVCVVGVLFYFRPKAQLVEDIVPAGALVFVRLDRVYEHLSSLRSSQFWKGISKINVPGYLDHEHVDVKTIEGYNRWRADITGMLDHPLFKQVFGKEVSVAFYPRREHFINGKWPASLSGILLVTRIDAKARLAESLGTVWNRFGKEWEAQESLYKNINITAVKLKTSDITIYYALVRDLLVAAVDERVVQASIDAFKRESPSINKDESYLAMRKTLYDSPSGVFYMDVPEIKNFLSQYWQETPPKEGEQSSRFTRVTIQEMLSQFDGIQANGAVFMAGKPIRFKMTMMFDPSKVKPEFKQIYGCVGMNNPTIKFVPSDTVVYQWSNCFDFAASYEQFKTLRQKESEGSEPATAPYAELEQAWGLSVEGDILPLLGKELGWFIQGIDAAGVFPIPKFAFFLKVNDEKAAAEILKKIATTPLTLVQSEQYQGTNINFVSIPLMNSLRPSYAFLDGYVLVATSDRLIKQSVDAFQNPANSLAAQPLYKEIGPKEQMLANAISFVKIKDIAQQSRALVDWANNWFSLKIEQAIGDEEAAKKNVQVLKDKIVAKEKEREAALEQLNGLTKEQASLQAQVQASAVVIEAKDTLAQQGPVNESASSATLELQPQQLLERKKLEAAEVQKSLEGILRTLDSLKSGQPELEDMLTDFEKQKADALKFRFYVDEVVAPLLDGLESLEAQSMTSIFKDGAIESELILKAQ